MRPHHNEERDAFALCSRNDLAKFLQASVEINLPMLSRIEIYTAGGTGSSRRCFPHRGIFTSYLIPCLFQVSFVAGWEQLDFATFTT